jgi:hypothetical protein
MGKHVLLLTTTAAILTVALLPRVPRVPARRYQVVR